MRNKLEVDQPSRLVDVDGSFLKDDSPAAFKHEPLRLLFVYGATGAGHLSSCRAVKEEIKRLYGDGVDVRLLDPTGGNPRHFLRRMPRVYGLIVRRAPKLWGVLYRWHESKLGERFLRNVFTRPLRSPIATACAAFDPHAIVSFHALTNAPSREVAGARPMAVVVTDLGSIHRAWLERFADLITLPNELARRRACELGLRPDQLAVTGLPVSRAFEVQETSGAGAACARRELGLDSRFTVLLTGGGEGVGLLRQQAVAILDRNPEVVVAVVSGRNRRLHRDVNGLSRQYPSRVVSLGFIDNMATWMLAADLVLANAGPGTITEAIMLGAALVLTGALPGQEQGNVGAVVDAGAALHAEQPEEIADLVQRIYENRAIGEELGRQARAFRTENATNHIASQLMKLAETGRDQRPHIIDVRDRLRHGSKAKSEAG